MHREQTRDIALTN